MFDRRSWGIRAIMVLGAAGAVAVLFGSEVVFGRMRPAEYGTARVLVPTIATAAAMAWAVLMSTLAVRRLDEYQLEASKFAWYWGGALGLAASVVGYAFIGLGGLHWLDPAHHRLGPELYRSFQVGYLLGIGCPFLGFLAARLWWQVARR